MLNVFIQILWVISSIMIFVCGIYFCFKLRFIHLNFKAMVQSIKEKSNKEGSISAFKSLTMSLAGRIGVGSLSGIALAVYLGGPGVLFWIWLTSIFCATTTFAESILAVVYRKKDTGNIYQGGPFYYIKEGLKNKKLAFVYALIVLVTYIAGFSTMQINTISKATTSLFQIDPMIIGIVFAVLSSFIIFGGVKKIADTTSKVIPFMTLIYLLLCGFIIFANFNEIPNILRLVFDSAFNFKSFGFGVVSTLLIGMQKGIFSSEVGLGTGSIAAATADSKSPVHNALVQTLGIHIENILFATITTFVVCLSKYADLAILDPNGIEITIYSFAYHIGNIGPIIILIAISMFGFSSILTGYYYGETSLKFMKKTNKFDLILLKFLTLAFIVIGSVISSNLLWSIVDVLIGLIAIINIYAIFKLRHIVIDKYKEYKAENKKKRRFWIL